MAGTIEKTQSIRQKLRFLPDAVLFADLLFILCLVGLSCFSVIYPEGDVFEHLQAAFLVATGNVPYRDFFEHHHPLLWYLTGGIVKSFYGNMSVVYWMNYLTYLFFCIGLWYSYKTVEKFIFNRTVALASVVLMLCPNILGYYVYFKPDNYMLPMIAGGIYYFFSYMEKRQRSALVKSFLFFWVAFAFLQKALLFYPVIAAVALYLLIGNKYPWRDFLWAALLPLLGTLAVLVLLLKNDLWHIYYVSNFTFNAYMPSYMGEQAVNQAWLWADIVFGVAGATYLLFFKTMNKYFRIYGAIFISVWLSKKFYFSPHVYYWYEAYYLALPIALSGVMKLSEKTKGLFVILLIYLQFYVASLGGDMISDIRLYKRHVDAGDMGNEVINRALLPCDTTLLGVPFPFNKQPVYYGFIRGEIDVIGERIGIAPKDDLNAVIEKYLPAFVAVADVYERYELIRDHKVLVHAFDMDMIKKYYTKYTVFESNFGKLDVDTMQWKTDESPDGIWRLKPEYRRKECTVANEEE